MTDIKLTHLDDEGHANMVDVGDKAITRREAWAAGEIRMQTETLAMITTGGAPKGDVLAVARVAGIMAAKRTHELIPLCHPLPLTSVKVLFEVDDAPESGLPGIVIRARTRCTGQTGVEMEALTSVSVAALTIYDMCKAVDRAMRIGEIRLQIKRGGKSGETILEQVDE